MVLEATSVHPGHACHGGRIKLSVHSKWLLTGASDGYIMIREIANMVGTVLFLIFHYLVVLLNFNGVKHLIESIFIASKGNSWFNKFTRHQQVCLMRLCFEKYQGMFLGPTMNEISLET